MSKIREKMIWNRMKRLAAAHPFFHRKNGLLSMREAKTLLREKEIPDGQEVVRRARIELGIPEPVSSATISSGKTLFSTVSRGRYFVLRRGLICLSVLLIVFGLFTMTEAGTAFAKGIYNVIVSVFDGSLLSRNEDAEGYVKPIDFTTLPAEFESLEAVAEATGRQIVIPGSSDSTMLSFTAHMIGQKMLVVKSQYIVDGKEYAIVQSLYNDSALWSGANSTTGDSINTIELTIGIKAYLSTMEDGTVYAEAFDTGHDLNISSTMLSVEELKEVIMNLKYVS
mgnify:CR=1 FL=1